MWREQKKRKYQVRLYHTCLTKHNYQFVLKTIFGRKNKDKTSKIQENIIGFTAKYDNKLRHS